MVVLEVAVGEADDVGTGFVAEGLGVQSSFALAEGAPEMLKTRAPASRTPTMALIPSARLRPRRTYRAVAPTAISARPTKNATRTVGAPVSGRTQLLST